MARDGARISRSDHSKLGPGLIVASLFVLADRRRVSVGLARLMNRQEGRRLFNNPKQLFRSLCRGHQLAGRSAASRADWPQPADRAAGQLVFSIPSRSMLSLGDAAFEGQELAVKRLRDRLFGGPS